MAAELLPLNVRAFYEPATSRYVADNLDEVMKIIVRALPFGPKVTQQRIGKAGHLADRAGAQ